MAVELENLAAAGSSGSRKVSARTRTENWTAHEIQSLVFAKKAQIESLEGEAPLAIFQGNQDRWKEIVGHMEVEAQVTTRSDKQCKEKWEGLQKEFKKIKEYLAGPGSMDYWTMSHVERRQLKLPVFFDKISYDCMEKFQGKKYIHMSNNAEKKVPARTRTVNWTAHEIQALVYAKKAQWEALSGKPSMARFQGQQDRWRDIVSHMESEGQVRSRTVEQSRGKWEGLQKEFKRIKEFLPMPGARDYWNMSHADRRQLKLPVYFDRAAYECMEEFHGKRHGQLSNLPADQIFDANRGSISSNVSPHSPETSCQPDMPILDKIDTFCDEMVREAHDPEPIETTETPLLQKGNSSQTSGHRVPADSNCGKKRKARVAVDSLVRIVEDSNMSLVSAILAGNSKRDEHRKRMLLYEERKLEQRQALIDMETMKLTAEKDRDSKANQNMENLVSVLGALVAAISSLAKKE